MAGSVRREIRLKSLSTIRLARGLTQPQLAHLLGICPRQVCRYETGESYPRWSLMERLCKALGCTESQLLKSPRSQKVA